MVYYVNHQDKVYIDIESVRGVRNQVISYIPKEPIKLYCRGVDPLELNTVKYLRVPNLESNSEWEFLDVGIFSKTELENMREVLLASKEIGLGDSIRKINKAFKNLDKLERYTQIYIPKERC